MTMHVSVQKFDPAVDEAPYYVEGDIEWHEYMSALELLVAFCEQYEPVSFEISCSSNRCGRCGMMINGTPALVCDTPVFDGEDYTLEPLEGFPIVRDLVVDRSEFSERLIGLYDRTAIEPFNEETIVPEDFDAEKNEVMSTINSCIRCGCCQAVCPVVAENKEYYVGPAAMLAIAFRHFDALDDGDRLTQAVSSGLYRCIQCGQCTEVCPEPDIDHLSIWQMLRDEAEEAGLKPSYAD